MCIRDSFDTVDAKGMSGKYTYRLQVSPYDCTGCGSCVNVCLAKETALTMRPFESQDVYKRQPLLPGLFRL